MILSSICVSESLTVQFFHLLLGNNLSLSLEILLNDFLSANMAPLRIKRRLAAINTDNLEDHLRKNQARNTNSPTTQEDHITQVLEEIEVKVTKKPSQDINRTESHILGALSQLDEFF